VGTCDHFTRHLYACHYAGGHRRSAITERFVPKEIISILDAKPDAMNREADTSINPADIRCIVFDFGFTLSSDLYFKIPPPECPNWQQLIQQHIFSNNDLVDDWMRANISLKDIAEELVPIVHMEHPRIMKFLKAGCHKLDFNQAVFDFALEQRQRGRKSVIVTNNMDVFTQIVVPQHNLHDKFDIIINSFDYQEIDKSILWAKAFELLGKGISYRQSLLIEDGENNVKKFRRNGGYAYQYVNDKHFLAWLKSIQWQ
jgi:FMN phosphatase YigB (HAD superfamily)